MKCTICSEKAERGDYCDRHKKAYEGVVRKYDEWKRALEISWEEYLSEVIKNPLTGEWVKEVAEQLANNGEDENVA